MKKIFCWTCEGNCLFMWKWVGLDRIYVIVAGWIKVQISRSPGVVSTYLDWETVTFYKVPTYSIVFLTVTRACVWPGLWHAAGRRGWRWGIQSLRIRKFHLGTFLGNLFRLWFVCWVSTVMDSISLNLCSLGGIIFRLRSTNHLFTVATYLNQTFPILQHEP